jgi:uncharacterized membrane protein YgcG
VTGDLLGLDRALDELAAVGDPAAVGAAAEAAALAALAAALRAAVPAPPEGAAARGRAALLATASAPAAAGSRRRWPARSTARPGTGLPGRRWPARARALAAAVALAVAVPAALAGRASPGTPLWPLRQAGQQVRLDLTGDPVARAHLRLNTAELLLAAARDSGGYRRAGLAACREQVQAAMTQLSGRAGPAAAVERARAEELLADLDDLERSAGNQDRRGPGSGGDGDRSGTGKGGSSGSSGSGSDGGSGGDGRSGGPGGDGGSGDG